MKKRVLSFVLVLCMICTLLPMSAFASTIVDSGTCGDNVTWTLDSEGTLTISGTGAMENYNSSSPPWHNQCDSIKAVNIESGVTRIGSYAFEECYYLTRVTIPESVTYIDDYTFRRCYSLTNIEMPDSLRNIGNGAFEFCSNLTSIEIPANVTYIGMDTFNNCDSLASIKVDEGNANYHSEGNCLIETDSKTLIQGCSTSVIPSDGTVINIDASAFEGCINLTGIEIPNNITSLGAWAFYNCDNLKSIRIPDSMIGISHMAFRGCDHLTSVTIPDSVKNIDYGAFMDCYDLTSVEIPDSVDGIDNFAFSHCYRLTSAKFTGKAPTYFGDGVFLDCANGFKILAPANNATWIDSEAYDAATGTWNGYPIEFYSVGPEITYCGTWGVSWPNAYELRWKYNNFDYSQISAIRVGMQDAEGKFLVEYTASGDQLAFQQANGYITADGMSEASFYQEYNGVALTDIDEVDWSVDIIDEKAFAAWKPAAFYVVVETVDGEEYVDTVEYSGPYAEPVPVCLVSWEGGTSVTSNGAEDVLKNVVLTMNDSNPNGSSNLNRNGALGIFTASNYGDLVVKPWYGTNYFSTTNFGYLQFAISTIGYENLSVTMKSGNNSKAPASYTVSVSVDNGATWIAAADKLSAPDTKVSQEASALVSTVDLPEVAENQTSVLIRIQQATAAIYANNAGGLYIYSLKVESNGTDESAPAGELAGKTVILHSNDVHGAIEGYANMAALKAEYEAEGAKVILADAGDYSQGTTYVSLNQGTDAIDMMNLVGYDVATLGNHEFDYGWPQLKENMSKADFKVLCADVFENGETIFDGHTIIESDGVKIGFFGMETPEAQTKANPALIKGLTFLTEEEMYAAAQAEVDALKAEGADVIICIGHLGIDAESEPNRSVDMLANVEGVDFFIDGHSHSVLEAGPYGEAMQSTGTAFANIGVIVVDNATKAIVDNYLVPVTADSAKDEAVAAAAQEIIDRVHNEFGQVFAKSEVELNGDKAPNGNRDSETNLGDLVTDSMLWTVMKDDGAVTVPEENVVAITNGGGIRAWIHKGDITRQDINTVLPFGNTVAVVYVTGAELLEVLEASTYCTPTSVGGFPHVAGIDFTIAAYKEYDANAETYPASTYYGPASIQRVTINSVNGEAFDPEATYAVVTNNFCAAGGDTYYAFAAASAQFDTGIPMDEALMEYITEELDGVVGEKYAEPQGRISIVKSAPAVEIIDSGTCGDNVTWTLDSEGTFTVSGSGDMYDYNWYDIVPWDSYKTSITAVDIKDNVTSIGKYSFSDCCNLKNITIPDSVTSIGGSAFDECHSLTSITIPDSVTNIYSTAFRDCNNLTNINVAENNEIYTSVDGVLFSKDQKKIVCCPGGKSGVYTVPDSVTNIDDLAFECCYDLTSITIPDSVTSIGDGAFFNCSSLTSVDIPDSVMRISNYAFEGCIGLMSVTIPDSVTLIRSEAFYNCQSLVNVTIPDSVTDIGPCAFYGCSSLTSAKFEGNAPTAFFEDAFASCTDNFKILAPANNRSWTGSAYDAEAGTWNGYPIEFYGTASENPFTDVHKSSVYYDAVMWAVENGITTGFGGGHFLPDDGCTRGQVVTFLWRAAGCPEPYSVNPFSDVSATGRTAPYYKAILWAAQEGITTGYYDSTFGATDLVTRGQFLTFLWRFEGMPETSGSVSGFVDAESISASYQHAVAWGVENGVTTGYEDNTFRANDICTRWAVVLFMYRDMK